MSAFILALARIRNFGVMFLLAFAPVLPALAQQDNGVVTCPPPQPGFYFLRSTIPVGQACTSFQALQNSAGFCIYNRDESLGGGTTALQGTCEPAPASDPDPVVADSDRGVFTVSPAPVTLTWLGEAFETVSLVLVFGSMAVITASILASVILIKVVKYLVGLLV